MNQQHFNLVKSAMPQTDADRLFDLRITPDTKLPPMQPLFRMFDTPCFYRGELVADCGKAKSGKTTFLSILMASAVRCASPTLPHDTPLIRGADSALPLQRVGEKPAKVLWIDTEQSQQSTQEILCERVARLAAPATTAALDEQLFAFNLRGMGYDVRRRMVDLAVSTVRPDLVIIDGIKDLMTDINDAVQATVIMEQLMALAKAVNCCMVCVLHQNKSEADRNMRGSIGTELTNKAFEVFQCELLERHRVFKVSQTLSRRQRMNQDLYYRLSDEGLPEGCDVPDEQPRDALGRWVSTKPQAADLQRLFGDVMEGRTQRPFTEAMAVALKKCGVADAKTYYRLVDEALEQRIIQKKQHPDTGATWLTLCDDGALPF